MATESRLRKAGFVFVELYVEEPARYVPLFRDALGFTLLRDEGTFVELGSERGLVLLNAFDDADEGHPFEHYRSHARRGMGVEIGIVVDAERLPETWERARALEGFQVTAIVEQEWGMTDYRVVTPHGYYLRITTPPS
jgi:lactoylglutathione lyase